ncbi:MAG: hypothetical protein AAF995_04200 [Planctomycetota bacterium]
MSAKRHSPASLLAGVQRTLWDLLPSRRVVEGAPPRPDAESKPKPKPKPKPEPEPEPATKAPIDHSRVAMRDRYERVTRDMLTRHGVRVRKWRTSMSGVAWQVTYRDGTVSRLIESPRPKGPMSAAVFLHEIGHHAIGFGVYRPRCLEEYHAWRWSLEQMEACGLNVTPAVRARMRDSLAYAVDKARRRGLKRLPDELAAYFASVETPASVDRTGSPRPNSPRAR